MRLFIHILLYGFLALLTLAVIACGGESDGAADPTAPLAQSVPAADPSPVPTDTPESTATTEPTSLPPTPTTVPEPTRPPVTAEVGTDVGNLAPDYVLNLPRNRQVSSTDLVAQGKPVFILFHATW